jgi:hypothetical protein
MQQDSTNLTIKEGTISFRIKENKMDFDDSKTTPIFSINPEGGSIFIIKDKDNKLKVFFDAKEKERIDLDFDVSRVDSNTNHMVSLSWSLENKELKLYFDGRIVARKEIVIQ